MDLDKQIIDHLKVKLNKMDECNDYTVMMMRCRDAYKMRKVQANVVPNRAGISLSQLLKA